MADSGQEADEMNVLQNFFSNYEQTKPEEEKADDPQAALQNFLSNYDGESKESTPEVATEEPKIEVEDDPAANLNNFLNNYGPQDDKSEQSEDDAAANLANFLNNYGGSEETPKEEERPAPPSEGGRRAAPAPADDSEDDAAANLANFLNNYGETQETPKEEERPAPPSEGGRRAAPVPAPADDSDDDAAANLANFLNGYQGNEQQEDPEELTVPMNEESLEAMENPEEVAQVSDGNATFGTEVKSRSTSDDTQLEQGNEVATMQAFLDGFTGKEENNEAEMPKSCDPVSPEVNENTDASQEAEGSNPTEQTEQSEEPGEAGEAEQTEQSEEPVESPPEDEAAEPEEGMEVRDNAKGWKMEKEVSLSQLPPLATSPELDAENKRLYKAWIKRQRLPYAQNRTQLIQYIQREKVNALVNQKFDDAQGFQNALADLQKAITDQDVKDRNKARLDNLDSKLENANQAFGDIQKETARLIKEETDRQKDRRYDLKKKQEDELDAFEYKWNDEEFLKRFAKPSPYLLQLKNMERSMVLTKMFDQAEQIRRKVKEVEKEESGQAQERAVREMDKQRRKIVARHEAEQKTFEQHCQRNMEIIRHDQEMKIKSIQARQTKLTSEIDEWKMNPPTALPPIASAIPDLQHPSAMTPRTAQRYSVFKKVSKPPSITVKPLGSVKPRRKRPKTSVSLTRSDL